MVCDGEGEQRFVLISTVSYERRAPVPTKPLRVGNVPLHMRREVARECRNEGGGWRAGGREGGRGGGTTQLP